MEPVAVWPVIPWRWDPTVLHGSWHCPRVAPGPGAPQAGHLVTPPGVTQRGSEPETFFDSQQGQIFEGTAPKTPEAEAVVPPGPLTEALPQSSGSITVSQAKVPADGPDAEQWPWSQNVCGGCATAEFLKRSVGWER